MTPRPSAQSESEPRVRFFAAKLDDGPVKPGSESMWPTFGIRYAFYVETHDMDAADRARERLWESRLSDTIDAFVEGRDLLAENERLRSFIEDLTRLEKANAADKIVNAIGKDARLALSAEEDTSVR